MSYFKPQMLFFTRYWKDSLIHLHIIEGMLSSIHNKFEET